MLRQKIEGKKIHRMTREKNGRGKGHLAFLLGLCVGIRLVIRYFRGFRLISGIGSGRC
jgi:hypothetical protein